MRFGSKRVIFLVSLVCLTAQLAIVGTRAAEAGNQKGLLVLHTFKKQEKGSLLDYAVLNLFYQKGPDEFELRGATKFYFTEEGAKSGDTTSMAKLKSLLLKTDSVKDIRTFQEKIRVKADGGWGPDTWKGLIQYVERHHGERLDLRAIDLSLIDLARTDLGDNKRLLQSVETDLASENELPVAVIKLLGGTLQKPIAEASGIPESGSARADSQKTLDGSPSHTQYEQDEIDVSKRSVDQIAGKSDGISSRLANIENAIGTISCDLERIETDLNKQGAKSSSGGLLGTTLFSVLLAAVFFFFVSWVLSRRMKKDLVACIKQEFDPLQQRALDSMQRIERIEKTGKFRDGSSEPGRPTDLSEKINAINGHLSKLEKLVVDNSVNMDPFVKGFGRSIDAGMQELTKRIDEIEKGVSGSIDAGTQELIKLRNDLIIGNEDRPLTWELLNRIEQVRKMLEPGEAQETGPGAREKKLEPERMTSDGTQALGTDKSKKSQDEKDDFKRRMILRDG